MRVLTIDPSFRNTGWVLTDLYLLPGHTKAWHVDIHRMGVIETFRDDDAKRRSFDDLDAATRIAVTLQGLAQGADCIIAEIPSGSQSARAAWSLGVALGAITNVLPHMLVRITPRETKLAAVGLSDASKEEMVQWAVGLYPDAPWHRRGKKVPVKRNEHMADALGVLHAGMNKKEFADIARFFDGVSLSA